MIDLWFDFASSYSYIGVMRAEEMCRTAGVPLRFRPFLLGPIFSALLGINDSPFNTQPVRGRYMWRDVERLASKYRLPFQKPSVFPQRSVLAARVAILGVNEAWGSEFIRGVFTAEFGHGQDIGEAAVLSEVLKGLGVDPGPVLVKAGSEPAKQALRAATDEAAKLGLFGAPTAVVGGELFFGQDRFDDAIAWALHGPGSLSSVP